MAKAPNKIDFRICDIRGQKFNVQQYTPVNEKAESYLHMGNKK